MTPSHERARLRDLVAESCLAVPGAPFPLAARLAAQAGYAAVYLSGAAFSAAQLALPDIGLFTLTELATETSRIVRASRLPVMVDADTGFGEPVNVERTVVELESAGAAAIQLEDQVLPKRCGHLSGKSLVDVDVMVAKLRAAVGARSDPNLLLLARTDARAVEGLEAALARASAYLEAGADGLFIEALESREEFETVANTFDVPLVANMTEFGKSPLMTTEELAELGYSIVLFPVTLLRVAMRAMEAALAVIAEDGTQRPLLDIMQTRQELYDLLGYSDYQERDRRFFSGETHHDD